ncbi:hypothetical protein CMI47_13255 [Candidatus Pacearchaeota archaeon]|nr:hypothetical protein [Candidatus Pacearchaeota archaeon]|tara:strand:- start:330 stop:671 length:342 start_codon:yes stop_codon:yes gene_type:complete
MYIIGNIIYGIPLLEDDCNRMHELEIWDEDILEAGWKILYHGAWPNTVAYLGVKIDEFSECNDHFKISDLDITPTDNEKTEAHIKIKGAFDILPVGFTSKLQNPDIWIVWSTS